MTAVKNQQEISFGFQFGLQVKTMIVSGQRCESRSVFSNNRNILFHLLKVLSSQEGVTDSVMAYPLPDFKQKTNCLYRGVRGLVYWL